MVEKKERRKKKKTNEKRGEIRLVQRHVSSKKFLCSPRMQQAAGDRG
jgi:hypothetical protein